MRKIFIDCGGYNAKSVKRFMRSREYDSSFELYSFEPIEELAKYYKDLKKVTLIQKAVWTHDGEVEFYLDTEKRGLRRPGSTVLKEKISGCLDREHPIKIPCVDLSSWITRNFKKKDYIILKMNIEGAEYPILERMIKNKSIFWIDKAYISFHQNKMKIDPDRHKKLVLKLRQLLGKYLMSEMNDYLDRDERIN